MRNIIITAAIAVIMTMPASAQEAERFALPGSQIDVEALGQGVDTQMDISHLSLQDLRIVRNAIAARQGYLFNDYALRAIFNQTSWYPDAAWARFDSPEEPAPIAYTPQEQALVKRIQERERELQALNFKPASGGRVNTDNIVNKFQLESLSKPLLDRLARDGFAIVPRQNEQLFHCYENNDYHDFPNFVTTDLHLQMMHMFLANLQQEVERGISVEVAVMVRQMHDAIAATLPQAKDDCHRASAEWCMAYLAVANRLMDSPEKLDVPQRYAQDVDAEVGRIMQAADDMSPFLGYDEVPFAYSLFKPRGYYDRTNTMRRYFRAMMWLQMAPMCIDSSEQLRRAVCLADALNSKVSAMAKMLSVDAVLRFMAGRPDGVSALDVARELERGHYSVARLMADDQLLGQLRQTLMERSSQQTRIRPKEQVTCPEKACLMPQRYLYDSEVLQELADVTTKPTSLRPYPMGLDVMAAAGSADARRILIDELGTARQWSQYTANLERVSKLMPAMQADSTLADLRLQTLAALTNLSDERLPYFMQTEQWAKKSLNTALAGWAEMRHDLVLYAKQPMAAECGGGIPEPVVVGYVEPNVAYWQHSLDLLHRLKAQLDAHGYFKGHVAHLWQQVEEQTQFLHDMSVKELRGQRLSSAEFSSIERIGSTYEWLTLDILKDKAVESGMTWSDVQGPDKSVAVVADVYTANASNNPSQGVLHEAVGTVDDIFVVVEINGLLHLTRGAVFSYREFAMPPATRLTDKEWQDMLREEPRKGVPSWMHEILLTDPVPADNELIFYSSGC